MLKLVALDQEDLAVVSAHVQDAVLKVGDMTFLPREKRFVLSMNRFVWESARGGLFKRTFERRRAALHFNRVLGVRSGGFRRNRKEDVLELLAIRFAVAREPAGTVELVFAGGGAVRLEVECIEAQLADLGAAWETRAKPVHGA
jgi:hypothetical protein